MGEERDELFGELCVQQGYLTPEQITEARSSQKAAAELGMEMRLPDVVVSRKLLTREQCDEIARVLRVQTGEARIVGGYEVVAKLGEGGMGVVYKARSLASGEMVALKILPPSLARHSGLLKRFRREAKVAQTLAHENVVRFVELGFDEDRKLHYFALELIDGEDLAKKLGREGALPEIQALQIVRQIASALEHAGSRGLIHRDIKPQNIMVAPGGIAKLLDLGLARSVSAEETRLTQSGMFVGSPHYASPEQARGEREIDIKSDIYSLGATLYHMVTGETPFPGATGAIVIAEVVSGRLAWPADVNPRVSENACRIIEKMMAKDPTCRYQSPAELGRDIDLALSGKEVTCESPPLRYSALKRPARPGARRVRATATRARVPSRPASGRRGVYAVAALLVAVVAVILLTVSIKGERRSARRPASPARAATPEPSQPSLSDERREQRAKGMLEYARKYEEVRKAAADLKAKSDGLAATGDFDDAIAVWGALPPNLSGAIKPFADQATADLRSKAEGLLRAAEGEANRHLAAGKPADALKALDGVKDVEYAAWDARLVQLRATIEQARRAAADAEEPRASVLAAGRKKWEEVLSQARKLAAANRFDAAVKKASEGKALGLPGLEKQVAAALARIEKEREAHEAGVAAEYRKKYRDFAKSFGELVEAGKFAEAVAEGRKLRGKLNPKLETRLAADLALASGAKDFIDKLRDRLAGARRGAFTVRLPMGTARFVKYDRKTDMIGFSFGAGSTSLKTASFKGQRLIDLAGNSARGSLSAAESRRAACYLLARGEAGCVKELLEAAKKGGEKVADLAERLAVVERGAHEVEAEKLLARFDDLFKARSWKGAASVGARLTKSYTDTKAFKGRKDIAALIDQAGRNGAPIKEYTITLQEGQPIKVVGVAGYAGTKTARLWGHPWHVDQYCGGKVTTACGQRGHRFKTLVRFAVLQGEGGPLPDDTQIINARLLICRLAVQYGHTYKLRRLQAEWDDDQVTYNSAAEGRKWKTPGGDVDDKVVGTYKAAKGGDAWCEFGVTESLRRMLKASRNYGWRMETADEANSNRVDFAGRLYEKDKSLRPKLILRVRSQQLPGDKTGE